MPQSEFGGETRSAGEVTALLDAWQAGDGDAADDALALVYDELRRTARACLRREAIGHTLQPTALVHEAYMRLVRGSRPTFTSRSHFVAIVVRLMRQVLVNHARARGAKRRGGSRAHVDLDATSRALAAFQDRCVDLLALDEALEALAAVDPRAATIVELRFFGGFEAKEVADALGVSLRTVEREWALARAWLRGRIETP